MKEETDVNRYEAGEFLSTHSVDLYRRFYNKNFYLFLII